MTPLPQPGEGHEAEAAAAHASELLDRNRIAQARQVLGAALRKQPQHAGLLYELARADYQADANDSAAATLARVLAQEPGHVPARLLMFHIEQEAGRLVRAEEIILGLLREDPAQAVFYALYARLMLQALNFAKAGQLVDEALRRDPQLPLALRTRTLCDLVMNKPGARSDALVRLLADDPGDLRTMHLVVVALVHAGRTREAYQLSRELLRADPTNTAVVALVRSLRVDTHWSQWPLWPLRRWGWYGSVALWVGSVIGIRMLDQAAPVLVFPATMLLLAYVVYSWVWPPLLRRLIK